MKVLIKNCIKIDEVYEVDVEYLDENELYPDGKGGQLGDLGKIEEVTILKVMNGKLLLNKEIKDGEYSVELDERRRKDAMENHTGEHIFSGVAYLEFGWRTVGFRMGEEYCTLDFDVNSELINDEIISKLETKVNDIIQMGIPVSEKTVDSLEANLILGERKGIPEKVKGDIRIISTFIGDYNPCGGLHLKNTKDVKLFKILLTEKVKSSYTRFYFICGSKALRDYNEKNKLILKLSSVFSSQSNKIEEAVNKLIEEKKYIEKEKKELEERVAKLIYEKIKKNPSKIMKSEDELIKFYLVQESLQINLGIKKEFQQNKENYLLLGKSGENMTLSGNKLDCGEIFKILKIKFNLKGGGNNKGISFGYSGNTQELIENIEKIIKKINI